MVQRISPHRAPGWLLAFGAASLFVASACGDDDPGVLTDAGDAPFDAGEQADAEEVTMVPVELRFAARVGEQAAACGESFEGIGSAETTIEISDLRFYVSNIHLITEDGDAVEVELDQASIWQHGNLALLDFEDGTAGCSEFGNAELNDVVVGEVAEGAYSGVRFDLGVPFELNHLDVDTAVSPLNLHALQWNWRAGYIFLKLDMIDDDAIPGGRFSVHLGSTGCESGSPLEPPDQPCANPNRATIALEAFDPDADTIVFDLAAMLADTDLEDDSEESGTGCQSFEQDEAACTPIFANLGMSFETGACEDDCAGQAAFRVQ
jgi:uncharacterized repeat protein (TIGR04052 family)